MCTKPIRGQECGAVAPGAIHGQPREPQMQKMATLWSDPWRPATIRGLLTALAVGLGLSEAPAFASFGVEGNCTREDFSPSGRLVNSARYSFRVIVDGSRFDLVLKEAGSQEDYRQVVSDGTNTYYVNVFQTAVERMRARGEQVGENIAGGTALKRPVPNLGSYSPAGEIWLAYASGWYFAEHDQASKPGRTRAGEIDLASGFGTASGFDVEQLREKRPAQWVLGGNSRIPQRVTFLERGFAKSRAAADGSFLKIRLSPVYSRGFTNSHFMVLEETNTPAGVLPARSLLTSYWAKTAGVSSNDLWTRHVYDITGTNFFTGSADVAAPPALPGLSLICEARFVEDARQPKSSFSYLGRNFPSEDRVRSSEGYRKAKLRPQPFERRSGGKSSRPVFLTLMGLTTVALVAVFWILRRQRVAQ